MKRHSFFRVTLLVPMDMPQSAVKAFVESALKTEGGFYEPGEPETQIELRSIVSEKEVHGGKRPCG